MFSGLPGYTCEQSFELKEEELKEEELNESGLHGRLSVPNSQLIL